MDVIRSTLFPLLSENRVSGDTATKVGSTGSWRSPARLGILALNLSLMIAITIDLVDFKETAAMAQRWWRTGSPFAAETAASIPRANVGRQKTVARTVRNGSALNNDLIGWNPFGVVVDSGPEKAVVPTDAPDTRLNLTLMGIIHIDGSGRSGRALIHGPSISERAFRVDDTLPGNVRVAAIQRDRVLLERNGRFEMLRLPKKESGLEVHRDRVTSVALRVLREDILKRPDRVLDRVTVKPHQRQGRFVGYQVGPGKESGLLESFDLKPNDVITVVNDIRLDSPIKGMQALGSLANLSKLHLEVLRGSETQTFNYYLD